jgi:hypothetical protein
MPTNAPELQPAVKEFESPLLLSSPHMHGQRVKDAQYLLAGHNRFAGLAPYKDGKIDGDYGAVTAAATKSAKFWLGYPTSACDRVFGQTLYEYLRPEHWRPLPQAYQDRRAARLAAATNTPGKKALQAAIGQIGYEESPAGSNRTKFGVQYGFNGVPWCAIFESCMFADTGHRAFHYAACEAIYADAAAGRNGLKLVWSPIPGDLNIFNLHGDPFAHTSFFERWIDQQAGTFYDVGGNTGPASISNGGAVMRQERSKSMVSHFVRVT